MNDLNMNNATTYPKMIQQYEYVQTNQDQSMGVHSHAPE